MGILVLLLTLAPVKKNKQCYCQQEERISSMKKVHNMQSYNGIASIEEK